MARRKVIGLRDGGWWVWLRGAPAVIVKTEAEARALMAKSAQDFPEAEHSSSIACPDIRVVWDDPLPGGQDFHKGVFADVNLVLHRGIPRKTVPFFTEKQLAAKEAGWIRCQKDIAFGQKFSWSAQYRAAIEDVETLVIKRLGRQRISTLDQLDRRWPSAQG